jgi:hypothetical protein
MMAAGVARAATFNIYESSAEAHRARYDDDLESRVGIATGSH